MILFLSDAKLMERFPESESDGQSGKPIVMDFDEPHEWLAMLSSSDQHQNHQTASNQQTPRMTPKKLARPNASASEGQTSGELSSPQNEDQIPIATGDVGQQSNNFQLSDELVEDNIVASVVVDVDKDGAIQLTDSDGNELGEMMVSLSVELEPGDAILPSSDEAGRNEPVAVVTSPSKASAVGPKCKTSAVNHKICTIPKHAHGRTHSNRTGTLRLSLVLTFLCTPAFLGFSWCDHITNDEVMTRSGQTMLRDTIAMRRRHFIGHILQLPPMRLASLALEWRSEDGRGRMGRPKRTWQLAGQAERKSGDDRHRLGNRKTAASDCANWRQIVDQCSTWSGPK